MALSLQIDAQLSLKKMRGNAQFSFWILIALAMICFFYIVINAQKNLCIRKRISQESRVSRTRPDIRRAYAQ